MKLICFTFIFATAIYTHADVRSDVTKACNILETRSDVWPPEHLLDNAEYIAEMYPGFEESQKQNMAQRLVFFSGQSDYDSNYCKLIQDFTIPDQNGNYNGCSGLHEILCEDYKGYSLAFVDYVIRRAESSTPDASLNDGLVESLNVDSN